MVQFRLYHNGFDGNISQVAVMHQIIIGT